jgi:hypothetical protein
VIAYDKTNCAIVALLTKDNGTDAHYEQLLEMIAAADRDAASHPEGSLAILLIEPDHPRPNATWRRRFAEAQEKSLAGKVLAAAVTSSTWVRGLFRAISWITPTPAHFTTGIFPTFDDAVRWAEERRGHPLRFLHELEKRARSSRDLRSNAK